MRKPAATKPDDLADFRLSCLSGDFANGVFAKARGPAQLLPMISTVLLLVWIALFLWMATTCWRAPLGYEDEAGFHFENPPARAPRSRRARERDARGSGRIATQH
jgi:hypothetical protein